jgi:hypothetical protein
MSGDKSERWYCRTRIGLGRLVKEREGCGEAKYERSEKVMRKTAMRKGKHRKSKKLTQMI